MSTEVTVFLEQVVNGLALAGVYLLVALGITLIFGLTRIVFFAMGQLVTLGGFLTLTLTQFNINVVAALVISAVVVGLLAELLDLGLLRPTLVRPLNGFIISLGLIVALEAAYALHWSGDYYTIDPVLTGAWSLGGLNFSKERALLVLVTAVAAAVFFVFLQRTHYGRGIRALAQDRVAAQALGVPVGMMISIVFVIGCGMAALAGGLLGTIFPFTAFFGSTFLLDGFAVAIVGGLGSVRGAVVAALLLAMLQTMGAAYISLAWSYAILLAAMGLIILIRPNGLFASSNSAGADPLGGSHNVVEPAAPTLPTNTGVGRLLAILPRAPMILLFILGLTAPFILGSYRELTFATFSLVSAIGVYSLWFGFRFAGIFSVAQAAFVGVGAYTTALVATHLGFNFWLQLIAAIVCAAIGAAIFGAISFRASGSYFVILLFALSELQVVLLQNFTALTGGVYGIVVAKPADPLFGLVSFSDPVTLYYLVFVFACLVIAFLNWLGHTGFGKILTSLRDNDTLAQSLGLNTFRYRMATLIVSGACGGIAGALYLYVQLGIQPDYFNTNVSIQMVLMMIMGGSATLAGPMVGTLVATFLPEVLHLSPYQAQLVYGLLLVAIIVLLPSGIAGTVRAQYFKYPGRIASRHQRRPIEEPGTA